MQISDEEKLPGFTKCLFPPDESPCDRCDDIEVQLYYRITSRFDDEGDYFCLNCARKEVEREHQTNVE